VVERLEGPDEYITLKRASALSGLKPSTLGVQAVAGKLKTIKPGHDLFTTRRWLHEYLTEADKRDKGRRLPLPEGYVTPEGEGPPADRAVS
jgi:hypothetical protein